MYNYTKIDPEECEFFVICKKEELPNSERLFVELEDLSLVVFNIADEFYAIQDICSHDDGPLGDGDIEGYEVVCPRHGAHFDLKTGKALSLPAVVDIPAYPVRVNQKQQIEVGIPKIR